MEKLVDYANSAPDAIRLAALAGMGGQDAAKAIQIVAAIMADASASTSLKQGVLRSLGSMRNRDADGFLLTQLQALEKGELDPALHLDVLDALDGRRNMRRIGQALNAYHKTLDASDPLAPYRVVLTGGDAESGRKVFHENGQALCRQCHVANGDQPTAGPNLAGIGGRQPSEYLLRALMAPSADLAPGYEAATVSTMPPIAKTLAKREIRDLLAYLISLK
jgi:quinoprotein glucose dehydrogenase